MSIASKPSPYGELSLFHLLNLYITKPNQKYSINLFYFSSVKNRFWDKIYCYLHYCTISYYDCYQWRKFLKCFFLSDFNESFKEHLDETINMEQTALTVTLYYLSLFLTIFYLSFRLSIYLCGYPSKHLYIYLSIYFVFYLLIFIFSFLSIFLSN